MSKERNGRLHEGKTWLLNSGKVFRITDLLHVFVGEPGCLCNNSNTPESHRLVSHLNQSFHVESHKFYS